MTQNASKRAPEMRLRSKIQKCSTHRKGTPLSPGTPSPTDSPLCDQLQYRPPPHKKKASCASAINLIVCGV